MPCNVGFSGDGRNWTRTSDPHDVNVEVGTAKSLTKRVFREINEVLNTQFVPNQFL